MTDPQDPHDDLDLRALDDRAHTAAAGLRAHVLQQLDVDTSLGELGRARASRRWARAGAAAAVVALLAGTVAVAERRADDGDTRVDMDEALPDLEPGVLRPLGPRDGRDSVRLPVTAEPSTDLQDGDRIVVSSPGFEPGESVGLVQCAKEAGGETPETRGGIDGCYIGDYVQLTADADGVATGTYAVRRLLTTPLTGTVDCAAEAKRCLVALGAISDYDRSGGFGIEFAPGGEPLDIPTVVVTPTEGLADGDIIQVSADGLTPNTLLSLEVCSSDPLTCWSTGQAVATDEDGAPLEGELDGQADPMWAVGLVVDASGRVSGEVPVWRYLPGGEAGTYVDCAVSRCSLRLHGETAPPTVPLHFSPGGDGPVAPTLAVDPSTGLAPGDEVVVRGAGFPEGMQLYLSLCAQLPGTPVGEFQTCGAQDGDAQRARRDGTFQVSFEIPETGSWSFGAGEECDASGQCTEVTHAGGSGDVRCDGTSTDCYLTAEARMDYEERPSVTPPTFGAPPVRITMR